MAGFTIGVSPRLGSILSKVKTRKPALWDKLSKQLLKITREPHLGKPLRNILGGYRRVHVDSFVLVYEIKDTEVRLLDFDHHDRIYRKWSG